MFELDFIELGERVARALAEPPRNPNSGSQLISAFEKAWGAIQRENPDVPDVLIITGSGAIPFGLILGHFAESSWEQDALTGKRHEMFVGGEGLARGAREVMATLLHEAAHGMAMARTIKDTSRQGRYHNAKFKELAEEIGIEVKQDDVIGWSITSMPDRTAKLYHDEIEELQKAIAYHRRNPFADIFTGLGGDDGSDWGDKVKIPKGKRPKPVAPTRYTRGQLEELAQVASQFDGAMRNEVALKLARMIRGRNPQLDPAWFFEMAEMAEDDIETYVKAYNEGKDA